MVSCIYDSKHIDVNVFHLPRNCRLNDEYLNYQLSS